MMKVRTICINLFRNQFLVLSVTLLCQVRTIVLTVLKIVLTVLTIVLTVLKIVLTVLTIISIVSICGLVTHYKRCITCGALLL